ncbi:P-loop containing nucleoside triphosphate hydrolase protein [Limtongia smithiae]|uniref:P-loop containing nucleoside triphosphate hydrolase protein n=1 Tax=Limtongia smithiae TaxID=1125753 RepID=UPI0034CFB626
MDRDEAMKLAVEWLHSMVRRTRDWNPTRFGRDFTNFLISLSSQHLLHTMSDVEIDTPSLLPSAQVPAPAPSRPFAPSDPRNDDLPWVEKYRPSTLNDVAGHESIISTIRTFISSNRIPHLLFYGPPGTGKTSTILAVAREIYGKSFKTMVLELNASDERGIDVVREQIKTFASTRQMFSSGFKLIILDEADAMTNAAQNALRRIMEKYTTHTRFCILANYIHKLTPAIQSRCTRFRFSPIAQAAIRERVQYVIEAEHVAISKEALAALLQLSKGDMRRALNVLQACHVVQEEDEEDDADSGGGDTEQPPPKEITEDDIYECVGNPRPADIRLILDSMMTAEWGSALRTVRSFKQSNGLALVDILHGIFEELETLDFKPLARSQLIAGLAEIEYRLASGGSESLQTSAMIGIVKTSIDVQAS